MRPCAPLPPTSQVSLPPARGLAAPAIPSAPLPPSPLPIPPAAPGPADSHVPRVDSIMLLEEGFQVTSVDASDKMLKYALKERWERRKEEPFDRWGAGALGVGRGLRTLTPSQRDVNGPSQCSGHSSGTAAGRVALLQGPDSARCSADKPRSLLVWLLARGHSQHPQGFGKGWVMLGRGLADRGGCWVSLHSSISLCCSHRGGQLAHAGEGPGEARGWV